MNAQHELPALPGLADVEDPAHGRIGDLPYQSDFVQDLTPGIGGRREDDHKRHGGSENQIVDPPNLTHGRNAQPRDHPVTAGKNVAGDEASSVKRRRG